MKFVALLSGGKDSCFNIVHCINNGHSLVAAASLRPETGTDELDSFMYQTVGQDAIEIIAQALDVPLHRKVISGSAVNQDSEYGPRTDHSGVQGDETEDLYDLLLHVKSLHPEIEGVSVGAILSNYQRVRVEHVCRRLALTPLCYLWQRDQANLLSEMIDAGLHAILIKVAGIGLTPKHLGKSLGEMQPTLRQLNARFGAHICGEGGEYETLTLDCPAFKHRVVLEEVESVIHSDNDFATVAYLRIKRAKLESKALAPTPSLAVPPLLDDKYQQLYQEFNAPHPHLMSPCGNSDFEHPKSSALPISRMIGDWVAVGGIQRQGTGDTTIEDEVFECFALLKDELSAHGLNMTNCINICLFLSSMSLFPAVNAAYSKFFGTSPPARATVAVNLPRGIRLRMECIAFKETSRLKKQALHVQSLSYWAPANIGPYSQAITVDEHVFMSGQIGLIPASLSLPSPPDLIKETVLSFQHVQRIIDGLKISTGGGWGGFTQANIVWVANPSDLTLIRRVHSLETKDSPLAPTIIVSTRELPKGALVEKQVLVHTGRSTVLDDEGDSVIDQVEPEFQTSSESEHVYWERSRIPGNHSTFAAICCNSEGFGRLAVFKQVVDPNTILLLRLFHVKPLESSLPEASAIPFTAIPSQALSCGGRQWEYVLCVHGVSPSPAIL